MSMLLRILMALFLIAGLTNAAAGIEKPMPLPMPVPPQNTPHWAPVPGAHGVEHAPNIQADLFRYGQGYYYHHEGNWYQGKNVSGPWYQAQSVPPVFHQIQAPYFKRPPGWAKGKKKGWGGYPMPPGQMKKFNL